MSRALRVPYSKFGSKPLRETSFGSKDYSFGHTYKDTDNKRRVRECLKRRVSEARQ